MSVSLNGSTSNYLYYVGSPGSLAPADAQTWAGWFKPANTNAQKMAFATIGADGYTSPTGIRFNSSGNVEGYGGSGAPGTAIEAYSADVWYYVYWRGSGSTFGLRMGAAASGLTAEGDFGDGDYSSTQSASTTDPANVMLGKKGADGFPWNGELCCVRVWGAQLSTAELLAEAQSATPVRTSNLLANWRLSTNTDLTDTVNSYVLTANGTVSTGATEPADFPPPGEGPYEPIPIPQPLPGALGVYRSIRGRIG